MLMCVGACVCVYVHVLRIVSTDKILCFTNTLIINYSDAFLSSSVTISLWLIPSVQAAEISKPHS